MKKWIVAAVAALVVAFAGWYFASPGYAMMQLRDAAMSGEAEAMERRVDFDAVRAGMKADVKTQLAKEALNSEDGMGAAGAAFAMAFIDPMIDGLVSPEFIAEAVKDGKMRTTAKGDVAPGEEPAKREVEWAIERDGFNRFTAKPQIRTEDGGEPPSLVFERDGLGWKLVRIAMPMDALAGDKGN